MKSKRRLLLNSRLYLILDKNSCPHSDVITVLQKVVKSGVDLIQLREEGVADKEFLYEAKIIRKICRKYGIIFLINDRSDIALAVDADGVHLGQSDLPLKDARRILGNDKFIGISCRNLLQAAKAERLGADYISIGPVFRTQIKPYLNPLDLKILKKINKKIKIPLFAVGGINSSNLKIILSLGIKRIALCSAICCAQNVMRSAALLKSLIDETK